MKYICPICGYDKIEIPPYDDKGRGSFDICPCCGFHYAVHDDDMGYTFESYREEWIKNGSAWLMESEKPNNWLLEKQLKNLVLLKEKSSPLGR